MGTLNQGVRGTYSVGRSDTVGLPKYARAYYDFATDGGAIGSINLRGDKIPSGAVITSTYLKTETGVLPVTTTTLAVTVESAGDVRVAAVATGTGVVSAAGVKQGAITNAAPVLTTADRHVVLAIAAGTVTAGRFSVIVEYFEPAAVV